MHLAAKGPNYMTVFGALMPGALSMESMWSGRESIFKVYRFLVAFTSALHPSVKLRFSYLKVKKTKLRCLMLNKNLSEP